MKNYTFLEAVPVWKTGDAAVMNQTLAFSAVIGQAEDALLCVAGHCSYLVFVNDCFIAYGPARAAHDYYKVDELPLKGLLTQEKNTVTIRVVGYNVNSYCYLDRPSFLCAEIRSNGKVLAATGRDFTAGVYRARIQKVPRYTGQRTFSEAYDLNTDALTPIPCDLAPVGSKHFLQRDVPYCEHNRIVPKGVFRRGALRTSAKETYFHRPHFEITENRKGYPLEDLTCPIHINFGMLDFSEPQPCAESADCICLAPDTFADVSMGANHTGLFSFALTVRTAGTLFLSFDEILHEGNIDCFRMGAVNILELHVEPGTYRFVSAEPYGLQYLRISTLGAEVTLRDLALIEIAFPRSLINAEFLSDDSRMHDIFNAAILTFRANTTDIYMDCPTRERAGWLCDSYFTSQVERALTGKSTVEKAFLENFIYSTNAKLPSKMLPMCYPADTVTFIPNWAMWFGIELLDYYRRTGDAELIEAAKPRVYGLMDYFRGFENELGLLEKLESWVFVEWSKANQLVQDVSFPSNMLYSGFLDALGTLYGDTALTEKAAALRRTVGEMSMTESGFFCDNALRQDGRLVLSGERTEVCQYYAFFFGIATPQTHPELWNTLLSDFGYSRDAAVTYPEIHPANAFIGNYLRLELLARNGYTDMLYDNIRGYFSYMAETTGTLWEHKSPTASCNHGFASYVLCWMHRLGLWKAKA